MAFGLYVLIGLLFGLFFYFVPKRENISIWMLFFLVLGWLPLYVLGIVLLSIYEPHKLPI